ncbi:hypothetical protein [Beijerinckia sp. L45]|uniref:hypothetical protein n=1 Tax=Beijerinckia sp. L45 TaxID=1641855 RepID=UPI00131DF8F8|nr:hypothetical protein [Beijerinckia sp. L45]
MSVFGVSRRVSYIVSASIAAAGFLISTGAEAHVKWFCAFNVAGQPVGLENVLCQDFELLTGFAIFVLLLGCLIDRTFVGDALIRSLDRVTGALMVNAEIIMRATVGFFLVALWTLGGILLTPELTTTSPFIPWMQLAMAACLLSRRTMPLTALGIVVLFGMAVANYGIFHLMDYPIFLGIAGYLALVGLQRDLFGVRPIDVLRWATAITLMWASVEKWAYPDWSYPLFTTHPEMAMGYDPAFFMRAAGVVEFTMSFALIWTPLVRRFAAVMLAATFISAIAEFGKVDAIGHAPIIAVLLVVIGDQAKEAPRLARKMVLLPLQYGGALAAFLALYYVGHSVLFGTTLT